MPIYTVKDSQTGLTLDLEGDSPPTEQELIDLFAAAAHQVPPRQPAAPPARQMLPPNAPYEQRVQADADAAAMDAQRSVERDPGAANRFLAPANAFTKTVAAQVNQTLPYRLAGDVIQGYGKVYGTVGNLIGQGADWMEANDPVGGRVVTGARKLDTIGQMLAGKGIRKGVEIAKSLPEPAKNVAGIVLNTAQLLPIPFAGPAGRAAIKAGQPVKAAVKKFAGVADEQLGAIAENASWVPEETLRMASTREGRELLKQSKGKQWEIGQRLVDAVYKPIDAMPEAQVINKTLRALPQIDPTKITTGLSEILYKLEKGNHPDLKNVISKIRENVAWIGAEAARDGGYIDPLHLVDMRNNLDVILAKEYGKPNYKPYIEALKTVRHNMRQSLIDAAYQTGNDDYVAAMQTLSDKLRLVDRIKDKLGADAITGANRGESVIRNMMNKGNAEYRLILSDFDKVFGTNILEEANAARLAEALNKRGELPWFSQSMTGQGGNKISRATIGNPKLMSTVLGFTGKLANRPPESVTQRVIGSVRRGTELEQPAVTYTVLGKLPPKPAPRAPGKSVVQVVEGRGGVPDFSDPFYRETMTPEQMAQLRKGQEFNQATGDLTAPEYPEALKYKPWELESPEEQFNRAAASLRSPETPKYNPSELRKPTPPASDEKLTPADYVKEKNPMSVSNRINNEKIGIRQWLGIRGQEKVKLETLSPEVREKIDRLVNTANSDEKIWNDLYDRGLLRQPWSASPKITALKLHPEDVMEWINSIVSKKKNTPRKRTIGDVMNGTKE